jgi:hypothetical protein
MNFDKIVDTILKESPVDDISQIRSTKFTQSIPQKAKFKIGDLVEVVPTSHIDTQPALKRYGAGTPAYIVGMQRNTGPGHSRYVVGNRYYIEFEDGKIYPVSSMYLQPYRPK